MQKIKKLILVAVAACFMVVMVVGCSTTAGSNPNVSIQPPLFGLGGKLCAFGVCVSPEARIDASVPAETVIVTQPPVVAYAPPAAALYAPQPMPPARSYNDVPVLPVRTLEK